MVGGLYALIALSIVLIFKATAVFNFAIGHLMMLGGLFYWTFLEMLGLPVWLSMLLALILAAIVGAVIQRLTLHPLIGQPPMASLIVTIALMYLIHGFAVMIWRGSIMGLPSFVGTEAMTFGVFTISKMFLVSFVVCMVVFGFFVAGFRYTKTGLDMRATAEDHQVARAKGIKVDNVMLITWIIASIAAGVGGILLGLRVGVGPPMTMVALKAFPAVLIGGVDSIPGALIGGLLVGLIEQLAGGLIDPALMEIAPYVVLMIALIITPYGLFGLRRIERI
jgi:branched-chain amino acid transport system permease protein